MGIFHWRLGGGKDVEDEEIAAAQHAALENQAKLSLGHEAGSWRSGSELIQLDGIGKDYHLVVELGEIESKNIGEEVQGAKDLRKFAVDHKAIDGEKPFSAVMLDVAADSPPSLLNMTLEELARKTCFEEELIPSAKDALLLNTSATANIEADGEESAIRSEDSQEVLTWRRYIQGNGFIVTFARVKGLEDRVAAVVRLKQPANVGTVNDWSSVRVVCVVLTPITEVKLTKSDSEMAKIFAAMLQDDRVFNKLIDATSEEQVREAVGKYVDRQIKIEGKMFETGRKGRNDQFEDMRRTGKLFGGLIADVKRKFKPRVYLSDWTDGWTELRSVTKYISVIAWLYFAVIMPIIAFGTLNDQNTDKAIGISETVLSQAITGANSAIFAGQPLAVTMTTGPVTVFIRVLYTWSEGLSIPFLPFYAWTGIWGAVILTLIVAFDLIAYVKYVGQFTEEIFALLVAAIFIQEFIRPLIEVAIEEPTVVFLLSFVLASGMYMMSRTLSLFERSYLLNSTTRTLLADFGMPFSVLVWSAVRQIFRNVEVAMLEVPDQRGIVTTSGRSWLVPLGDLGIGYIFLAIVPALFLCMLFYVDQNVAVLLTNKQENKLRKGVGYYLDMQVIAVSMLICSILGVPWANAAVPHSHLHARILADTEEYEIHGRSYERVTRAREVRITNFFTHVLIFVSLFVLFILKYIPKAVVWGFFLYIGVATLDGNQMYERVILVFTQPEKYPPNHYIRRVPLKRVFAYTAIQVALFLLLWFINNNFYMAEVGVFNAGLLFPLIIAAFVPIRKLLLPKLFTRKELFALEMEKEDVELDE